MKMPKTFFCFLLLIPFGRSLETFDSNTSAENVFKVISNAAANGLSDILDMELLAESCRRDLQNSSLEKIVSPGQALTDGFWNLKSKSSSLQHSRFLLNIFFNL